MMKTFVYIMIGLFLMIFETVVSPHVSLDVLKPDIGMPIILYTTFFLGARSGIVATLCVGLFSEGLSGAPDGSLLFTDLSIFLIASAMRSKFFIDSRYSFAYVCSGAVIVQSLLFIVLSFLARGEARGAFNILFYALPNAIVTGFVSILLFSFIEYLNDSFLEKN